MDTVAPLRILIADDHRLVRAGIRALLESLGGVEVVGEACDGQEALRRIGELQPQLALVDIAMPGLNGLEVAERAHHDYPHVRILILSMHSGEEYVRQAMRAHAAGYLWKGASVTELELALSAVRRGEPPMSPPATLQRLSDYAR